MKKSCVVIGSGIAGMATAIRLVKQGYDVDIFEARSVPGGKIDEFKTDGFRFDAGPTVMTMPHLVDELFVLHGKKPTDYFRYRRLENPVRYFFNDGKVVNAYDDIPAYAAEIEKVLGVSSKRFNNYVKDARTKFNLTHRVFLRSSLHKLSNYLRWKALKGMMLFSRVGVFRTMSSKNHSLLENEHAEKIMNRYAQYNGSDPYRMPSTFNVIGHVEISTGVYGLEGGMVSITKTLYQLAKDVGIRFHFNARVEKIQVDGPVAKGIVVDGEFRPYSCVVSNADIVFTHEKLLKNAFKGRILKRREKSSSSVIFYWGINGQFDELACHNFFFGKDCKAEFNRVFTSSTIGDDFSLYVHVSSKHETTDAPEGCENWFVMINAPNHTGQDWEAEVNRLRPLVLARLKSFLKKDVESLIQNERTENPAGIANKYDCFRGAIYGDSSNNVFSALLRHPNFSKQYKNLYFAGGSVHPGAGIPLCLYSAEITADLIKNRGKKWNRKTRD